MAEKVEQRSVSVRIDGKEVENSLKKISKATSDLYHEVSKLPRGTEEYKDKLQELQRSRLILEAHKKEVQGIEQAWYKNIPAIQGAIAAAAGLFAIDQIVTYTQKLYTLGSELDNIARKSFFVLKDQLAAVNAEAKKNATEIGLAREQYVGLATDVTAFLQSQKFTRAEAAKMSTEVVNLSGVLSQFQGGGLAKTEEALEAIKGAFAEDVEQLAKFNIAISENVVQVKMQELGLDKANAAAQQHGRGMIILKMIMEGAKAQNEAFTGSADGMVRSQARIDAMLQSISNNLAKFFIPLFEKTLTVIAPVVEYLGELSEKLAALVHPAKAASEAFFDQKEKVKDLERNINPLINRYESLTSKSKLNKTEQIQLKEAIEKLGVAVPNAVIEVDKYGRALSINIGAVKDFMTAQQKLAEYLGKDAIQKEEEHKKAIQEKYRVAKQFQDNIISGKLTGEVKFLSHISYKNDPTAKENALKKHRDEMATFQKELDGIDLNLKRLRGEPIAETQYSDVVDMSGKSPADKKKENDILQQLKKLREAIANHNADVRALDADNEAQAVARIQEKYRKDIELAQSLEKQKGQIGSEAHRLRVTLETLRDAEILDIYQDSLDTTLDALEKHLDDANLKRLTADEQEAQQIAKKYDKDIEAARRIEQDTTHAREAERQKAHQLRLQLEATRDKEIQDAQALRTAQALQKEAEETAKFTSEREKGRKDLQKQIQDELNKPLENEGNNPDETPPQYMQRILSAQALEKQQLKAHFEELLTLAEEYGINTTALREKQKLQEQAIDEKYKNLTLKRQVEENQKRLQAYGTLFNELGGLASAFGDLMATQGEQQSGFQKLMTLAQIAFDTAAAISALTAHSEKNPGNATTFGVAGAIQFAAGFARIIANIGKAKDVLKTAPRVKQKFDGGEVIGEQDGKTYNPFFAGEAQTGLVKKPTLFLTGEGNVPEYVIAGPELKMPEVANFIPFLEAKRRQRVRGFADGGAVSDIPFSDTPPQYRSPSRQYASPNPTSSTLNEKVLVQMADLLSEMKKTLNNGVVFTFEHLVELGKMQGVVEEVRG